MQLLRESGVSALDKFSTSTTTADALRLYVGALNGTGALEREAAKIAARREMKAHHVRDAHALVQAAFAEHRAKASGEGSSAPHGQAVAFGDVEPWPDPVDGAGLLEEVRDLVTRYLVLPAGADVLLAAFAVYTWAAEAFNAAPYLVAHSPAPQCGKTRLLEVLALLVRRPWLTIVPSTAVLFRVLEEHGPTLLLDEAEVVHGRGDAAGDVRALLQSGYRRGAFVPRCVGESNEVRNFRVFGPKVFALIGQLPPALFDRCIPVEMQRRTRGVEVARFRVRELEAPALALRRRARRWAHDELETLRTVEVPPVPFLDERAEEVWEPLLAVGLVAGGAWFDRLHQAARALSGGRATTSAGVELLGDIQTVFAARGVARLASMDLATALNELEGRRWAEWRGGKGLSANSLARLLAPFQVAPTSDGTSRGYRREDLTPFWDVYIQPSNRQETSNGAAFRAISNRQGDFLTDGCEMVENPHGACVSDTLTVEMRAVEGGSVSEDPDEVARQAQREGA